MWRVLPALVLVLLGCQSVAQRAQPAPTVPPAVPEIRALPGRGFEITGQGAGHADEVVPDRAGTLAVGIAVVTLTHNGQSSFIVTALQPSQSDVLTTAIGPYKGQRPLVVMGPVAFDVTADGAWSVKVQPMSSGGSPSFSGSGDMVSAYFNPPGTAATAWLLEHHGQSSFFVYAHCVGGSVLVADRGGEVQDATLISFPRGPCFWEVRADGAWSLKPSP
jgi:hypothetical protein